MEKSRRDFNGFTRSLWQDLTITSSSCGPKSKRTTLLLWAAVQAAATLLRWAGAVCWIKIRLLAPTLVSSWSRRRQTACVTFRVSLSYSLYILSCSSSTTADRHFYYIKAISAPTIWHGRWRTKASVCGAGGRSHCTLRNRELLF